jgi:hypothetical protein
MKTDPAITRTRDARRDISASVADDPVKLVEYYIVMQKRFGARVQRGPHDAWEDDSLAEQQRGADAQKDARGSR